MNTYMPKIMLSGKTIFKGVLILCSFLFLSQQEVQASHIVGGDLTYRCLGNNMYEIRLTVRRDCFFGDPLAYFDDPASVGFYDGVTGNFLTFLGTAGLLIPLNNNDTLNEILVSDCSVVSGDVCVHTTTYVSTIFLPFRATGYTMAYQRCCRNISLTNVLDPTDTGMTLVAELSPLAQQECNSSPRFGPFAPIYTCVNKPIMYDHSAEDLEGDSLVYSLCTPYGGATEGSPRPQPPVLPLDEPITYRAPYSLNNLMGGVPLAIDPATGIITGTPNTIGQFVIGLCVSAYKNGVLTGTTRRDFQYNVRMCRDVPVAQFSAPALDCDDLTVTFDNQSQLADDFVWYFNYPDTTLSSTAFEPTFTYTQEGFYNVALIASDSLGFCYDTLIQQIGVFDSQIEADFSYDVSSCTESGITLDVTDLSSGFNPNFPAATWDYLLTVDGNVLVSNQQNPTFNFDVDGQGSVLLCLVVTSTNGCTDQVCKSFPVNEISIDINPASDSICFGESTTLLLNMDLNTFTYTFDPAVDNPSTSLVSPEVTTTYSITVTDGLCEVTGQATVNVQQLPSLAFDFEADCRTNTVVFDNISTGGILFMWDFGTTPPSTSMLENPTFTFPGPGIYTVTLSSKDGCDVSISQQVTVNSISETLDDVTINCFQTSVELNPDNDGTLVYSWSPGVFLNDSTIANPTATVTDDTEFCVTITSPGLPNCPIFDCITVIIPDDFTVNAGADVTSCTLEEIKLTATVTGNTNVTYVWTLDGDTIGTTMMILVIPQETETYIVTVTDSLGCSKSDAVTINRPPPTFTVEASNDTSYCNRQIITLIASSEAPGVTFDWYNDEGVLIGNGPTIEVSPQDTSCYIVIGTDPLFCENSDTVCLTPTYFDLNISTGHNICLGECVELSVTDNNNQNLSHFWFPTEFIDNGSITSSPLVCPPDTTTYCDIVTNLDLGCVDTICTEVVVSLFDPLVITIDANPDTVTLTESTQLIVVINSPGDYTYSWSSIPPSDIPPIFNPVVTPNTAGGTNYTVTVTNEAGCTQVASISIFINDPPCDDNDIFIPNAFTPNGDGFNDVLFVRGNFISTMELHIYNRWGQEVFSTTSQSIGWDGKFDGKILEPDVFGYYMDIGCPNQKTFFKKGNITLLK